MQPNHNSGTNANQLGDPQSSGKIAGKCNKRTVKLALIVQKYMPISGRSTAVRSPDRPPEESPPANPQVMYNSSNGSFSKRWSYEKSSFASLRGDDSVLRASDVPGNQRGHYRPGH